MSRRALNGEGKEMKKVILILVLVFIFVLSFAFMFADYDFSSVGFSLGETIGSFIKMFRW